MLEREVDSFFHVRDDDQRAHRRREIVVRVALEVHVLREVFRLHQLADVVEIRADAAKRGVRADRFRGRLGQVRDDQAVMISARRFDRHSAQQRMIQIGSFQPGNVGRDLEEMFENRQDAAHDRRGQDPVSDRERALDPEHLSNRSCSAIEKIDRADDPEGHGQKPDGDANAEAGANEAAPPPHL